MDVYSDYTSDKLIKEVKKANALSPFIHALSMFISTYIVRRGFLDGLDGMVIALLNAGGTFFKYAKYLDKRNR